MSKMSSPLAEGFYSDLGEVKKAVLGEDKDPVFGEEKEAQVNTEEEEEEGGSPEKRTHFLEKHLSMMMNLLKTQQDTKKADDAKKESPRLKHQNPWQMSLVLLISLKRNKMTFESKTLELDIFKPRSVLS
jgi:hypothetical protein